MAIVHVAFMLGRLLGTAAGYLVDGVSGATSGFLIPMGPAVVAWLFGGLTIRYDRYGRRDRPSLRTRHIEPVRLRAGSIRDSR